MREYIFVYKNNEDDRDCVKYADLDRLNKLECGHYYPRFDFCGACFSGDLDNILTDEEKFNNMYENMATILTKEDFRKLAEYNKNIDNLGYGLDKYPEKQNQASQYYKEIEHIIEKLKSEENVKLFEQVQEEEIEYLENKYYLSREDIEQIFDNYCYDYRDRAIIGTIHNDTEDLGADYVENYLDLDNLPNIVASNLDYEGIGVDLLEMGENYLQLEDERIIEYAH